MKLARKTAIRWSNIAESKVGQANTAKIARLWPAKGTKSLSITTFRSLSTVSGSIQQVRVIAIVT